MQAAELLQVLASSRQHDLSDGVRVLRKRGPSWRKAFDAEGDCGAVASDCIVLPTFILSPEEAGFH
jgi:hypothetical protein